MIKALWGETLLLGLIEEELEKLKEGKPIDIGLTEITSKSFSRIGIIYAKDLREFDKLFAPYIGPNTKVHGRDH